MTHPVTVTAPPGNAFATDTFARTVTNAWGTADLGEPGRPQNRLSLLRRTRRRNHPTRKRRITGHRHPARRLQHRHRPDLRVQRRQALGRLLPQRHRTTHPRRQLYQASIKLASSNINVS